jgi:hypothetical protein
MMAAMMTAAPPMNHKKMTASWTSMAYAADRGK